MSEPSPMSAPSVCSICHEGEDAFDAKYLVLGAGDRLGDDPGILTCSFHLEDAVDRVTAPAQVWPA